MSVDDRHPWDQRPDEGARAFHAFCHYRDMPPETRSLRSAYRVHLQTCKGVPPDRIGISRQHPGTWKLWVDAFQWLDRIRAWDDHLNAQKRKDAEAAILAMSQRHSMQSQAIQAALLTPVRALLDRINSPDPIVRARTARELDELTVPQLARLSADTARYVPQVSQFERVSRGLESDTIRIKTANDTEEGPRLVDAIDGEDRENALAEFMERLTGGGSVAGGAGVVGERAQVDVRPAPDDPQ